MFTSCPLALMKPRVGAEVQVNYVMKAKSMARTISKTIPAQKSHSGRCSIDTGMPENNDSVPESTRNQGPGL